MNASIWLETMNAQYILVLLALVVFVIAAFCVASRVNLIAVGLALMTLAELLGRSISKP